MTRLSEEDSVPRVEDGVERHMRLCTQNSSAEKYKKLILQFYNDFEAKKDVLRIAGKEVNAAQDTVWLCDSLLDDKLRDLLYRAKEYDRSNPGSNTVSFLFPNGNITSVITMPDKDEPTAAHAIAQKVQSLGNSHVLFPFAIEIEKVIDKCRDALESKVTMMQAEGDAATAMAITKAALVRQYNANYFLAASDVDKNFAEKLFPQIHSKKKKEEVETSEPEETGKN